MFARHTRTRMRPSDVVYGFKSLASKLHPQLPLTPRESQSLLKTLTTSFRKHLDKAHPTTAENSSGPAIGSKKDLSKPSASTAYSSAVATDQFLESVLTNPVLLGKVPRRNVLDLRSAVAELEKTASQDPVELLERYQEQGAASVQIAELCLEAARAHYAELPTEQAKEYLNTTQPGRRALRWLLTSRAFESVDFWNPASQQFVFSKIVTRFLLLEGRERNIWHWLSHDLPGPQIRARDLPADLQNASPFGSYAWRGAVVGSMAAHALGDVKEWYPQNGNPGRQRHSIDGINRAMDVFIQAAEMRMSVASDHHLHWINLRLCYTKILSAIMKMGSARQGIDVARFDRFHDLMSCTADHGTHPWVGFTRANLQLWHPDGRQGMPTYEFFRSGLDRCSNPEMASFLRLLKSVKTLQLSTTRMLTRAIVVLRHSGHEAESEWLSDAARRYFPLFQDVYVRQAPVFAQEYETKPLESPTEREEKQGYPYMSHYSLSLT